MPQIHPIPAVEYVADAGCDISSLIAPPYDVLDEQSKALLLSGHKNNIVAVDLPHLPPKTVGPDETYEQAGQQYRDWLTKGVMAQRQKPALFAYQQRYSVGTGGRGELARRGLMANVRIMPFGPGENGQGGIHPHEQTFSGPKEDRLKLMRATRAQLSPIFGLYIDTDQRVGALLDQVINGNEPSRCGKTGDGVVHELWEIDDKQQIDAISQAILQADAFIADGHHRYNTALNYKAEQGELPADHPANNCLFVLVSMQDPGMIVLPTHRVLGAMPGYTFEKFVQASQGKLKITPVQGGDLEQLEAQLPSRGPHAMGLYDPAKPGGPLAVITTTADDPLAKTHPDQSQAWRQLDVAIVQHLIVEQICQPLFCEAGGQVAWKFPHSLDQLDQAMAEGGQLGLIVQATPLDSVRQVSEAGELMPQKSTFFYPKLATGLVVNPLEYSSDPQRT
jgi:uncharacterized protein (DUF1015 family)